MEIRFIFFADTHLGFDLPLRPKIEKRRRGHDFFDSYHEVLSAARELSVDFIVHGGDLLYRSKVRDAVVMSACEPLLGMAEAGIPVYYVPGNHDRSRAPDSLFLRHKKIHIFDKPETRIFNKNGFSVSLSAFPYCRDGIRSNFHRLLSESGYGNTRSHLKLLCLHEIWEGASVGPVNYTFRNGADVIPVSYAPLGKTVVSSATAKAAVDRAAATDLDAKLSAS